MKGKVYKDLVQMNIRHEVGVVLDELLDEQIYRHCFISGDEAWTLRYSYAPTASFSDEAIYSGYVLAKAKKKFMRFIEEREHRFAFCVRVRGKYDMDVVLNPTNEGEV